MKVEVVALRNIGEMKKGKTYELYKETADVLIKMGRVITKEQLQLQTAHAAAAVIERVTKINEQAEQREKKITEPEKNKGITIPKLEKPKRGRPRRK